MLILSYFRNYWIANASTTSKFIIFSSSILFYFLFADMKMSKVGNQTNSQDPQAVNSRVFVGNLNTFQCSKTDVERMFQRYGRLVGEYILYSLVYNIFSDIFFYTESRKKCVSFYNKTCEKLPMIFETFNHLLLFTNYSKQPICNY